MNLFTKTALVAGLSLATLGSGLAAASADQWNRRHNGGGWNNGGWNQQYRPSYNRHGYHRRDRGGDALAAGVLGLAAGAIIAGAISQPQPVYREPIYNAPPAYAPAYGNGYRGASYQPWSREWYNWCSQRYRSFNAQTGTYRGYDGADHFCNAN